MAPPMAYMDTLFITYNMCYNIYITYGATHGLRGRVLFTIMCCCSMWFGILIRLSDRRQSKEDCLQFDKLIDNAPPSDGCCLRAVRGHGASPYLVCTLPAPF